VITNKVAHWVSKRHFLPVDGRGARYRR